MKSKIKAVIIDDEPAAREALQNIISLYCREIQVAAEADGVKTGIDVVKRHKPDLLFLDVQMRDGSGFDLLEKISPVNCKVIFVTAYEEFAIQAFRFAATDYLLKPVDPELLTDAVQKYFELLENQNTRLKLDILLANINLPKESRKIILRTSESIYAVNIRDIVRCESDGNYTRFYLKEGRMIMTSRLLREYDDLLSHCGFFRSHQSYLINLDYFDRYQRTDGGMIIMKDGSEVPLAVRKKEQLMELIDKAP